MVPGLQTQPKTQPKITAIEATTGIEPVYRVLQTRA